MKALLIVLLSCGLTFGMWGCAEKDPTPPEPTEEEAPEETPEEAPEDVEKAPEEGAGDVAE